MIYANRVVEEVSSALVRLVSRLYEHRNAIMVLAILPVILVAVDRTWIYPRPDMVDPWMYISYFLDPQLQAARFPGAYHGERLPIILPGALAFSLFPAATAIVVLHFALYYLAVFSLYAALACLFCRATALLTSVLCGTYAMFLTAMGQTHADSFGIGYALLTTAFLAAGLRGQRWHLPMFLAGGSSALFLFTNIAYAPVCILFAWLVCTVPRDCAKKPFWTACVSVASGFALATSLMCIAGAMLDGQPWFFLTSLQMATTRWNYYCADPGFEWIWHAWWLVTPMLVAVGGMGVLWMHRADASRTATTARVVWGAFILVLALLALLESFALVRYLQFSFYASLLIPPMFLAIGAMMAIVVKQWETTAIGLAVVITVLMGVLAVASVKSNWLGWAFITAGIGLFLMCMYFQLKEPARHLLKAPMLTTCFGALNILIGVEYERFLDAWPLERRHVKAVEFIGRWDDESMDGQIDRARVIQFVADIFEFLKPIDREKSIRLWYSVEEPLGSVFTAVASTFMWDQRFVTPAFPSLRAFGMRWPLSGIDRLVILSDSKRNVQNELNSVMLFTALPATKSFDNETALTQQEIITNPSYKLRSEHDFRESEGISIKATVFDLPMFKTSVFTNDVLRTRLPYAFH
jgi:hypothetical protein